MGNPLKKRKTYTDADIQNIYNDADYQKQVKEGRLVAMHEYLADTSGKYAWELDVDLVDYISRGSQSDAAFVNQWEKARKFSMTTGYEAVGETIMHYGVNNYVKHSPYKYLPHIRQPEDTSKPYPIIPLKLIRNNLVYSEQEQKRQINALCKLLNWDFDELVKQMGDGFGGEWGNITQCALGLFVEFPNEFTIDKYHKSKGLATYLYTLIDRYKDTITGRTRMRGVVGQNHYIQIINDTFKGYSYITKQPHEYDYTHLKVERGDVWVGFHKESTGRTTTVELASFEKDEQTNRYVATVMNVEVFALETAFVGYTLNKIDPDTGVLHSHRLAISTGVGDDSVVGVYHLDRDVELMTSRGVSYTLSAGKYFYDASNKTLSDYIPNYDDYGDLFVADVISGYDNFDPKNPPENFRNSLLNSWIRTTHRTFDSDRRVGGREGDVVVYATDPQELDFCAIPLDADLMTGWSNKDKAQMIRSSLAIVYRHSVTVKVYRGWVGKVIKIGSIILAAVVLIKSFGTGAKLSATLLKLGATIAASLAIDRLIDIAVKLGIISPRVGVILKAVVAVVMLAYGNGGFDFTKLLTAVNIMQAVNVSFNAYVKLQQMEINQVTKQMNAHNTMHAQRVYELQEKQRLHLTGISPYAELYLKTPSYTPNVDLFETVEMMYARHHGYNVVAASQGLISHLTMNLYTGKPKLYQIQDSSEDLEDMLIIA